MNSKNVLPLSIFLDYFDLKVRYSDDLPDQVYGVLDPAEEPRFIIVKSNLPKYEEVFTIVHEVGHHVLHPSFKSRRTFSNWFTLREWKIKLLAKIARGTRMSCLKTMNEEWQADLWTICFLVMIGEGANLTEYLKHHPEKNNLACLAMMVCFYQRIINAFKGIHRKIYSDLPPS